MIGHSASAAASEPLGCEGSGPCPNDLKRCPVWDSGRRTPAQNLEPLIPIHVFWDYLINAPCNATGPHVGDRQMQSSKRVPTSSFSGVAEVSSQQHDITARTEISGMELTTLHDARARLWITPIRLLATRSMYLPASSMMASVEITVESMFSCDQPTTSPTGKSRNLRT